MYVLGKSNNVGSIRSTFALCIFCTDADPIWQQTADASTRALYSLFLQRSRCGAFCFSIFSHCFPARCYCTIASVYHNSDYYISLHHFRVIKHNIINSSSACNCTEAIQKHHRHVIVSERRQITFLELCFRDRSERHRDGRAARLPRWPISQWCGW